MDDLLRSRARGKEGTMKEIGMLFSAPMVRAILAGKKTQTRRVVDRDLWDYLEDGLPTDQQYIETDDTPIGRVPATRFCKYQPGDRLWVRETFGIHPDDGGAVYRATDPDWETCEGWTWKPSIHMPRWASRITLEVTGVRVERLPAISFDDAVAEGSRYAFAALWDSSYADRGYGWDKNPWVWVVEFKLREARGRREW